ncbi:MAG: phosphoribosylanthranilate isomerase [Desulfuromonas sp.]|nr:MAG: phosphoribosylanthranilate isomerase [Desulfuromonas sp.]
MRVKICGITNKEDALHAVASGADALGFVFYDGSPRCVSREQVAAIVADLPPLVTTVGLFVNAARETISETIRVCGLNVIQLHGDETPEECSYSGVKVVKALRLRQQSGLAEAARFSNQTLLVDAYVPGEYGGTGSLSDWELARQLAVQRPIILAGGLTPENVAAGINAVKPYAVDVSSGVEASPGKKDPRKVTLFIKKAKEAAV